MKVIVLLIFALSALGASAHDDVHMFDSYEVICSIHVGGQNHTHKAPSLDKGVRLEMYEQYVCIVSGVDKLQSSVLSFYSSDGMILFSKRCTIINGDIIVVDSNIIEKASKVSISLSGKEYIGILK